MYMNKHIHTTPTVVLRIESVRWVSISHFIGLKVLLTLTTEAGHDPEKYTLTPTNTCTHTLLLHTLFVCTNPLAARNNTGTQEDKIFKIKIRFV